MKSFKFNKIHRSSLYLLLLKPDVGDSPYFHSLYLSPHTPLAPGLYFRINDASSRPSSSRADPQPQPTWAFFSTREYDPRGQSTLVAMSKIATADINSSRDVDAWEAAAEAMDRAGPRSARTGDVLSDKSWALDVCVKLEEMGMARLGRDVDEIEKELMRIGLLLGDDVAHLKKRTAVLNH